MMQPLALQNGNEGRLAAILAKYGLSDNAAAPTLDATGTWAQKLGLQNPAGFAARANSGNLTKDDIQKIGQTSSVAPQIDANGRVTNAIDFWSDAVTRAEHGESGNGGIFGIKELSTGIPLVDNAASMLLGNTTGGQTGYNAATGGDVKQGVATDVAGLGAGAGLAQALPALGLSTVAPTAAAPAVPAASAGLTNLPIAAAPAPTTDATLSSILAGTGASEAPPISDATLQAILNGANVPMISQGVPVASAGELPPITISPPAAPPAIDLTQAAAPEALNAAPSQISLADTLSGNAAGGLKVVPEAADLSSAIAGASGATGASGITPGLATENLATGLGSGLSVPGVTVFGSTGAIGAAGVGLGAGLAAGAGATGSAAAGATAPAVTTGLGATGTAAAAGAGGVGATKLGDVLSGNVGLDDLAKNLTVGDLGRTLGTGLATAGSIYADTQRTNAQKEMYNQYLGLGAPSRARYEASFAPGFDVNSIPGFTNALDTTTNSVLRKLSTSGNPFGNPGQLTEAMNYISGNLALPALNNYRNQNAATGGFGAFSTAAPGVGAAAIDSGSAAYSDLARGASDIFNPPTDLAKFLRQYQGGASAMGLT